MCAEITEADHSQDIDPVRRLPVGAECQRSGGVHFRVWARRCQAVSVIIEGFEPVLLQAEAGGYFSGLTGAHKLFCRMDPHYHSHTEKPHAAP